MSKRIISLLLVVPLLMAFAGCSELPGNRKTQGAVIGGAAGAAAGAAIGGDKHRVLGALLGGAVGAGGGYVVGAKTDKIQNKDETSATQAATKAEQHPATAAEAKNASSADINSDGFVTLDEVVALKEAGFTDDQMLQKLRAADQVFELTSEQQQYLRDHGVSAHVVDQMQSLNKSSAPRQVEPTRGDVIGTPK
jgi:hypothetical protein